MNFFLPGVQQSKDHNKILPGIKSFNATDLEINRTTNPLRLDSQFKYCVLKEVLSQTFFYLKTEKFATNL